MSSLKGNNNFLKSIESDSEKKARLKELVKGQNPFALVITCSDSRVIPEHIFDCLEGELFVIRSAGNVINDGELASIEYGLEHLNIKYVLVLGHTRCGAVHAAMHHEKGQYLEPILSKIERYICALEYETTRTNAVEQAKYILEKFPNTDAYVRAAIYDIETNKVEFIDC